MTETLDKLTTRSAFLRRVVVTLGAAAGLAAFPSTAHAVNNCCQADNGDQRCVDLGGQSSCPTGQQLYFCSCPGIGDYCYCRSCSIPPNCPTCLNGPC